MSTKNVEPMWIVQEPAGWPASPTWMSFSALGVVLLDVGDRRDLAASISGAARPSSVPQFWGANRAGLRNRLVASRTTNASSSGYFSHR